MSSDAQVRDALALRQSRARVVAARKARRAKFRRRRTVAAGCLLVVGCISYVISSGTNGTSTSPASATNRSLPGPTLSSLVERSAKVPGSAPHLPWPAKGQGALAVLGSGVVARSPHERAVPIASLTKMMTALLVMRAHPLALGSRGPVLEMTRADAGAWVTDSQNGDSTVPVRAGEHLTEYQLLEGLLIPSGDNVADILATWVAGSVPAFVRKMNAEAKLLGLSDTHYADASGVDPHSVSTAADQADLATYVMTYPVIRRIVSLSSVAFPVAGTIWNYNPALGSDGIVGVKSGFTSEAQGCLVTAAYRTIGGRSALVVSASTGQLGGLYGAAQSDEAILNAASTALVRHRVAVAGGVVADASYPWSSTIVPLAAPTLPSTIVVWPGTTVTESVLTRAGVVVGAAPLPSGTTGTSSPVGTLAVVTSGGARLLAPLVPIRPVPAVPPGWVASHG